MARIQALPAPRRSLLTGPAASYSATTSSFYCAVNIRQRARSGPPDPALLPLAGRSSSIAGHLGTVEHDDSHLGKHLRSRPREAQMITEGRVPQDSFAERAASSGRGQRRPV